ncbi:MAG: hypothetical protein ACTHM7_14790 [Ginsengibacter sp.]
MVNVSEKEWQSYFLQLNEAEKKSVLLMLRVFLQRRDADAERASIEQYNKEIDDALAEVQEGHHISQDEMEKIAVKW